MRKVAVVLIAAVAGWLLLRWLKQQPFFLEIEEARSSARDGWGQPGFRSPVQPAAVPDMQPAPAVDGGGRDDLTRIKGIGPVFQARLNAAGITTFALLAQASPADVSEALAAPEWQRIEPEAWIAQAAGLAGSGGDGPAA